MSNRSWKYDVIPADLKLEKDKGSGIDADGGSGRYEIRQRNKARDRKTRKIVRWKSRSRRTGE